MTIRRWWADGRFPQPKKVGGRLIRWNVETLERWFDQRPTIGEFNEVIHCKEANHADEFERNPRGTSRVF